MIISISDLTTERLNLVLDRIKGIVTIPIGINFQTIDKIEPSKMKSEVIFAGRLLDFKNIDILIRAIRDIRGIRDFRGKNREVSCFIVGDGPERQRLIRLTKRLGLEKNIRFFGFLENQEEVFSLMKSSKIFVLPSSREGFGIVVLEANACELPVITVDRMENAGKELIKEGKNGFVCKLDSKEIASKIAFLLERSSPREKMGKEAVSLAKKYDWGKVIEKIEGVYLNRQVA
jgi:glycosyltransferase involved in cell wall biosynthesis